MASLLTRAQSLVNAAYRAAFETRASKGGRLISLGLVGQPVWTPRRYDELARESYNKNAVAFRAIHEIGKCAGMVPFNLFRGSGKTRVELEEHPLLSLLERPNPLQSRSAFIQAIVGFILIAGNAYIERVGPTPPSAKPPRELWIKRPDRMKIIAGKRGLPAAFEFSIGGQKIAWPVSFNGRTSKILHIKTFNPLDDWYGMSAVEAAAFSIDRHNESGRWNMSRLQNDARPSGALVIDPKAGTGLSDVDRDRLKAEIEEHYSGAGKAGRPLLLEGGLDWKEMGQSAVDMDWLSGMHTSARDIAMVFGMPSQMLGIPGDNTHRNMEEARLWLWEQTIIPLLDSIKTELNWWLTPLFGDDLELMFDLDEVPALITRRHQLWDKVNKTAFLTVDEKREAVGYEPLPDGLGEVVLVPKKDVPLGEDLEEEGVTALPAKPNGKDKPNGKLPKEAT